MTSALARLRTLTAQATPLVLLPLALVGCGPVGTPLSPAPPPSWPAPALVQVEDHPEAHPHAGLQRADIVFEYLAEGGISRFTAIYFHPTGADRIEPVRSARLVTLRLQRAYHGLIFCSGASDFVLGLLYRDRYPFVTENNQRYFERDPNRDPPHNLYTTEDQLKDGVKRFDLRIFYQLPAPAPPDPNAGTPAQNFSFMQTSDHKVTYRYSAADQAYEYFWGFSGWDGGPEVDVDNGNKPLMVANVVVAQVPHVGMHYTEDVLGAEGIDWLLQGKGPADVFIRGRHYKATWDMTDLNQPLRILDLDGKPMKLAAGLTWIHLVDPGTPITLG